MSLIHISDLSFTYEGSYDAVFEHVSFQLDTDWKLGFTGRNGRGKTTFLKLLAGEYAYQGRITCSVPVDYFPFAPPDPAGETLEVARSVVPDREEWELLRELSLLEVEDSALYRPFNTLSSGERTKVLLAALFLREDHFLLIDEPTNHLDVHGRELLSRYLSRKKGFILVSHDRSFLDGCVDHILSINRTDIEVVQGNFSSWYRNKTLRDDYERAENRRLTREIGQLERTAREKAAWSDKVEKTKTGTRNSGLRPDRGYIGHQSAKMMSRAKAIEGRQQAAVREKSELLKNVETAETLKISQLAYHSSRLVSLREVSVCYDGAAVCQNVSFTVERGDRVSLRGKNGSGKSSILKLIRGEAVAHGGELWVGSGLEISCVPQDTGFLRGSVPQFVEEHGLDVSLFKAVLRKLDIPQAQFDKRLEEFSGGQRKKVLIARSLCEKAHLHVWDEPLNFIDVISRMQIEDLILSFRPTLLFVEHDQAFCDRIATKTVTLG